MPTATKRPAPKSSTAKQAKPGRAARTTAPARPATRPRRATPASAGPMAPAPEADLRVEASSGNVFADLGFADAEDRLTKAQLARIVRLEVRDRMEREGWTQARAAKLLGIPASDMSDLMRGKLARFGQERLEAFLTRLDLEVRIQVGPRPAEKARAEVTVERVAAFA